MTRYNFQIDKPYAAKLTRAAIRPIENDPVVAVSLIRLVFAIYRIVGQRRLESDGEIACRDLIVGPLIPQTRDAGLVAYAQALCLTGPVNQPESWTILDRGDRWMEIKFGPLEKEGGRNSFSLIKHFDATGWSVNEYRYDRTANWVTIAHAADAVRVSESTARRRLEALEQKWGEKLVTRTDGGHRRIFLQLFVNLWNE